MLDIAVSYNKYKFLGDEFLTWVWYLVENNINIKTMVDMECNKISLELGNSIVLENSLGDESSEKISIKGDDAGLEEGTTALRKGAVVTDINLILIVDESEWRFSIKGESMNITSLKTPATGNIESQDDIEGAVLEKIELYAIPFKIIDSLFDNFIKKRVSDQWKDVEIPAMRQWIAL